MCLRWSEKWSKQQHFSLSWSIEVDVLLPNENPRFRHYNLLNEWSALHQIKLNYELKLSGCRWNAHTSHSLRFQHTPLCSISAYTPSANTLEAQHGVTVKGQLLYHEFSRLRMSFNIDLTHNSARHVCTHAGWGCHKPVCCGYKLRLYFISMLNSHRSGLLSFFCLLFKQICLMPLSGAEYLHCVCMCLRVTTQEE